MIVSQETFKYNEIQYIYMRNMMKEIKTINDICFKITTFIYITNDIDFNLKL